GKYVWQDGGYYEGEYLAVTMSKTGIAFPRPNGLRHGHGTRVWSTGARYDGPFVDDKMEGGGVFTDADGARYEGAFIAGRRRGEGRCRYGNASGSDFSCVLGRRHPGKGHCEYSGAWRNDVPHGDGRLVCVDGRETAGRWIAGRLCGWGRAHLIPDTERGDPARMHIGGVGGLYRLARWAGRWNDGGEPGEGGGALGGGSAGGGGGGGSGRDGFGVAEYACGDRVVGDWRRGAPRGYGIYVFARSLRLRAVFWATTDGHREWAEWASAERESRLVREALRSIAARPGLLLGLDVDEVR
ncbi:unnamed protein product, partial [Phaeothamnion confervicola]